MSDTGPAQTVGRAAHLLRVVAANQKLNLRLVDVVALTGLDKSTAHRLLRRLVDERLLAHEASRGYCLGPLLYELGMAALPETNLREIAYEPLHVLAQSTGDMVFLMLRVGFETVCVSRIAGSYPVQTLARTEGDRLPLGVGASGVAILAAMKNADVDRIIDAVGVRLPAYGLERQSVRDAVRAARGHNGISADEGSVAPGVVAIARVLCDRHGSPVAALSVASIAQRMEPGRRERVIQALVECASAIEDIWHERVPKAARQPGNRDRGLRTV